MIKYKSFFQDRMLHIVQNLMDNWTKTTAYLSLEDLKRKTMTDLFIINRVLQRFLLTMKIKEINTFELQIATRAEWMSNQIQICFSLVMAAKTEEELSASLTALHKDLTEVFDTFNSLIGLHSKTQRFGDYSDIQHPRHDHINVSIPTAIFPGLSTGASHVNMFFPFAEADANYDAYKIISWLKTKIPIHLYGFSSIGNRYSSEYYKYLTSNWTRCNIRYNTFDSVFMSYSSAFGSSFQEYKRGYNYVRPGGSIFLYGMRSDMIPTQLEKLAATLQDIHVFFFSHSPELTGQCQNDFFILQGKKELNPDYRQSYYRLLSLFMTGDNANTSFNILGSETDVVPFRSYSMTEDEYLAAMNTIRESEKHMTDFLFPSQQEETRRPLLPFTSGQLGLVLISGDIDGVIEEKDSHCRHAVKGYSSRKTSRREEAILDKNDMQIGTKQIKLEYPITMVRIIRPDGKMLQIGG